MEKIKVGIVGMGLIGVCHIDAVRRIGFTELLAIADSNYDLVKKKAEEHSIEKCYSSIEELVGDDEIQVVHNCTPNNLHLEVNKKIIEAGKHIFSEKPLGRTSDESAALLKLLEDHPQIVNGVNFNYRMNPLVQDMKHKVKNGKIGIPQLVHGSYLQDFLMDETDYNWRMDPEIGGPSRCIADIGSHWMDAVQTVTGASITQVCADLVTVIPKRKKPSKQVETFSVAKGTDYEEVEIKTEDYGAVLFKMDNGAHGVFYVSEISAGRKCWLNFEINGSKASYYWNQEIADRMWMGFKNEDNREIIRNPNIMASEVSQYTYLPAGHPEGWNDALKNNMYSFYKFIADGKVMGKDPCDFATFQDGHYIVKLTEAILKSSQNKSWVTVK